MNYSVAFISTIAVSVTIKYDYYCAVVNFLLLLLLFFIVIVAVDIVARLLLSTVKLY